MSEFAYATAIESRRRSASGRCRAARCSTRLLERVDTLDKPINSVVTLDAERARSEADAADAALARGEVRGPCTASR